MSRTDKTRPYWVKLREAQAVDPYRARRGDYVGWDREVFGCAHSCWMCAGSGREQLRRRRRIDRRNALTKWEGEYE